MSDNTKLKKNMDINEVMEILPQRYPFLMIDKVIDLELPADKKQMVGRKIKAVKNVTVNEPYFPGHFPHRPVMPGVMQVEAMAQTAALACYDESNKGRDILIAGINKARFRRPVVPGDVLIFESVVIKYKSKLAVISCKVFVGGDLVSEAEVLAALGS